MGIRKSIEERTKTWKGFFDLVSEMRQSQKRYFATRNPVALKESKCKEKVVDDYISYHLETMAGIPQQGDLYL
jgi:hypothetical protein